MPTSWPALIWRHFHAGNLTRGARDVLLTLATFRGHGGAIWPAHDTLADRARCGVKTVARALTEARELGLVSWSERRIRRGWRWLRTSNSYRLEVPADPVRPGMRTRPRRTTGHFGGEGESQENQEAQESRKAVVAEMMQAAGRPEEARAALARIAATRAARAAAAWHEKGVTRRIAAMAATA